MAKGTSKAKGNASHQAAYRDRHLRSPDTVDSERLNTVIPFGTKRQLERLALHYGVSQRAMLTRLLAEAENTALDGMTGAAQNAYYDLTQ